MAGTLRSALPSAAFPPDPVRGPSPELVDAFSFCIAKRLRRLPDAALWRFRNVASKSLVEYTRERLSTELASLARGPGD
jgi:hypothetical protein